MPHKFIPTQLENVISFLVEIFVYSQKKRHQLPSPSPDHCQKALGRCQPSEIDDGGTTPRYRGKKKITWGKLLEIPENPLKAGTGNIFGRGLIPTYFPPPFFRADNLSRNNGCFNMKGMCFAWSQSPNVLCLVSLFGTWRFRGCRTWVLGGIQKRWVHSMLIPRKSNPQKTTPRLHYRFQRQEKWDPS